MSKKYFLNDWRFQRTIIHAAWNTAQFHIERSLSHRVPGTSWVQLDQKQNTNSLSLNSVFLLWPQHRLGSQQGCVRVWVDKWISEITLVIPIDLAAAFVTMTLKIYFLPLPLSCIILDVSLVSSSIKSSLSQFFPHPTWAPARSHSFIKALKSIPTATKLIHPVTCFYLGYCRLFVLICTVHKACTCTSSHVSYRH